MKTCGDISQFRFVRHCVPAVIAGQLIRTIGHQSDLGGMNIRHEADKILGRIALNIELHVYRFGYVVHVRPAYVALVGTRVHRHSVCAKSLAVERKL